MSEQLLDFLRSLKSVVGDLSQVSAPSVLLNGYSMTEYSKYWMDHPELLENISELNDPKERIVAVCKWFLSTLHGSYASRGYEKKPYNPVLGEQYLAKAGRCEIFTEQVSHHPPVTAFEIKCGENLTLNGHIQPYTTFKGTHVDIVPSGRIVINVKDDVYLISLPHLLMRGLYQISPYFEILDHVYVVSKSGFTADFEFFGKGYFSGDYFLYNCKLFDEKNAEFGKIEGNWTKESTLQYLNGIPQAFFSVENDKASEIVAVDSESVYNTYKIWGPTTQALRSQNYKLATEFKNKIENDQRSNKKKRISTNLDWSPNLLKFCEDKDDAVMIALVHRLKSISKINDLISIGTWKCL
eukprot:NODE_115_length_18417_cov_0.666012.p7 type:complete len:354 gc:universal NODE_115_length_18417_cov_0.666012:9114-8053(-)